MARKKKEVYWELVRKYRESEDGPILEEALGLYCSKERAMSERSIYEDTECHEVQDEITVDLKVRKYTCLLYTSPSPRDRQKSRMPSSA